MYYAVSYYFKTAAGLLHRLRGNYSATPRQRRFQKRTGGDREEDEPTLLVLTDAAGLPAADYFDLCQAALAQCQAG